MGHQRMQHRLGSSLRWELLAAHNQVRGFGSGADLRSDASGSSVTQWPEDEAPQYLDVKDETPQVYLDAKVGQCQAARALSTEPVAVQEVQVAHLPVHAAGTLRRAPQSARGRLYGPATPVFGVGHRRLPSGKSDGSWRARGADFAPRRRLWKPRGAHQLTEFLVGSAKQFFHSGSQSMGATLD
ncbi:unnamed protein product [Effrenium voratum]|nr:unnamed protein product [Effrenium voratum]